MGVTRISTPLDIAVSGLKAESMRMNVIASNIANASTTRTPSGEPYRRQEVVMSTTSGQMSGVTVSQVAPDMASPFKRIHDLGNPDADKDGYVMMPNVDLPTEMMSMVTASRAYQANAAVMKRHQDISDVTLELLK